MLLIDFDELMETYNDFYNEFAVHDLRYLKKECLPIVEAIPIEYIEKFKKKVRHIAPAKEVIEWLLEDWEKENGQETTN